MDLQPGSLEERFDDAMFDFTMDQYDSAIAKFEAILVEAPDHFDSRLSLGMAWYRKGDYPRAIAEGHLAEKLRPTEQLVHTNLSLFYMKAGDKKTAEHHGLQARIASWRGNMDQPATEGEAPGSSSGLEMAAPPPQPTKVPTRFPDMPWKKKETGAATPIPTGPSKPETQIPPAAGTEPEADSTAFVFVAEVDSLPPGQGRTVEVKGRRFALWNVDGGFYAIDDTCPHRGGPLGAGVLDQGLVHCPLHGWGFDPKTGACDSNPDRPVASHRTRVEGGRVFLEVGA